MRCPKHCMDILTQKNYSLVYLKFEFNRASCILSGLDPLICKYSVVKRAGIWSPRPRSKLTSWEPLILRHFPPELLPEGSRTQPGEGTARWWRRSGSSLPRPLEWDHASQPEPAAPTPRERAAPAEEGPQRRKWGGGSGVPEAALPWTPRRTGWWNPCACKSCGPGPWALGLEVAGRADWCGVGRPGSPGVGWAGLAVGRGRHRALRLEVGSGVWEAAPPRGRSVCGAS